jgi:uncharacterized protein (DUF2141 family)
MNYAAACLALFSALLWHSPRVAAETLTVKLTGLHPGAGVVRVMLWKDASAFPTQSDKAVARKVLAVTGPELEMIFSGLPRGTYAAGGYQDENNNGAMDRSILGWPTEPTAASNGARGMMGPPSFSAAAFELKQASQTIQLNFK